uniref:pentatricopeptide repeat-containing protein At3g22670, mitochondrial n=1 Tax=Erigeron canadensis TaxID=72917 RepID=UPI001CB92FF7|nr:pentatricopeptide repeat-containing protein At3g22670, mitochondrial [Erigeron canadensis]
MYARMMNSRSKLYMINRCCSRSKVGSSINKVCDFLSTSFSTLNESPKNDRNDDPLQVTESPELPIWVKLSETDTLVTKTAEEDFLLPSVSDWIEGYKHNDTKLHDKTTVSNNTADTDVKKITKVLFMHFESVDSVVKALNESDFTASEHLVVQMLKRFDNNWKSAYGVFTWAESQMGVKLSPDTYDLLVDSLGKSKNFDLVWKVVEKMVGIGENYVTINTMAKVIRRLTKAGLHEEAIDAFRRINQFGVKKDLAALNLLVDALAKDKNVELANDIFVEFKKEIPPNSHTFNVLIHGWSKARKLGKALATMEEMKEHGILPDVISYTSIIEAYCSEKDFRKVDQILEEMEEKGCPPNIVTYTIVMLALGKAKEFDEALKVYEKMKSSNIVFDAPFYSSLIYILSRADRVKDAREVFDEMPVQGIKRDTETYNAMITCLCNLSQEEDALKLLHEMEKSGVRPDFDTYSPLLKMCLKLKRMKVLSFLLSHMLENNVSVGLGMYSLLVRGLCKNGKLKHACLVLEDAVMRGFVPYDTMFKVLETELEKQGMSMEKKRIQELRPKNAGSTDNLEV